MSLFEASAVHAATAAVAVPERGGDGGHDDEEEERGRHPDDRRHGDRVQHGHTNTFVEGI